MKNLISIKWRNAENKWEIFPLTDILHLSRNHAIDLFSGKIAVVAKEAETYMVNSEETQRKYISQGKPCQLFSELIRSEEKLQSIGFTGEISA